MIRRFNIFMAMVLIGGFWVNPYAWAEESGDGTLYQVTITNLTRGQVITPPVIYSHLEGFRLFSPGDPAIPELVALAEDGPTADLLALLETLPEVHDSTAATGVILPGESDVLEIYIKGKFNRVGAVGMLATSNDAFFGIQGVKAQIKEARTVDAIAYDAGSEANSESCTTIPGPPCGNPFVRDTADAEGFVHIHSGIHGIGDLDLSTNDWRNPVARIQIERVN